MSTTSYPLRLLGLQPALAAVLCLALSLGAVGCTSTSSSRRQRLSNAVSNVKTFLAVGDKPLPVVTGEPGSTVSADESSTNEAAPRRTGTRSEGRISGRVYDMDGQPVPDARVRLAVDGARGGKVVRTTTDASGAFTLHGLRPGSTYTLIAEWDGEEGPMTGRITANASDTGVKISLGPVDDPEAPTRAAAPGRINRVSDREPLESGDDELEEMDPLPGAIDPAPPSGAESSSPTRGGIPINEEDLPPAVEAEALDPSAARPRQSELASKAEEVHSMAAASQTWRRRAAMLHDRETTNTSGMESDPGIAPEYGPRRTGRVEPEVGPVPAPLDLDARGTAVPDDGPDPLPPALEPGQLREQATNPPEAASELANTEAPAAAEPPAPTEAPVANMDAAGLPPVAESATEMPSLVENSPAAVADPTAKSSESMPPPPIEPAAEPAPFELLAQQGQNDAATPRSTDPFARLQPSAADVANVAPEPEPTPAVEPAPKVAARDDQGVFNSPLPAMDSPAALKPTEKGPRHRPTWGEVTATTTMRPEAEPGVPMIVAMNNPPPRPLGAFAEPARITKDNTRNEIDDPTKPMCDYDDRHRRIVDFRLTSLDGRPVRFRDLDADLVLIDFWGTWCSPCLKSIPHLVDLQERMGKRLTVLGVACEAEAPDKAAAKVTETVRSLNVNYPVLLSRNDGSCPLQQALHIQAFPTLILVDREGRVLWRDQGATPATLARLDRVLASTPNDANAVRR